MTAEAETAAEIAHFEPVESYIRNLFAKPSSLTDDEKTLIAGNLRAFYATVFPFELDDMDRQMIDEAWETHKAAKPSEKPQQISDKAAKGWRDFQNAIAAAKAEQE